MTFCFIMLNICSVNTIEAETIKGLKKYILTQGLIIRQDQVYIYDIVYIVLYCYNL